MVKNKICCLLEVHSTPMTQSVCLPTHLLDFSLHNSMKQIIHMFVVNARLV